VEEAAHPRLAAALRERGPGELPTGARCYPDAVRTAAEAAAAVGCESSQICRPLVFAADGEPALILMDGAGRVDVEAVRGSWT
jgi:prolyl-tRNA editing enzyme YbaK/EbsC (Cys-tRNA(Pro) deacylase)